MEHEELRRKLSAYLDNVVGSEEKEEIKRHLKSCGSCRGEIADLELTVGYLKSISMVEPPPWLKEQIMTRVRELSETRPSLWRRLFFPLYVKLPLEALALVLICVTGYYLARTVGMQEPLPILPSSEQRQEPAPPSSFQTAPPPSHPGSVSQPGAALLKPATPKPRSNPTPAAVPSILPKPPETEPIPARQTKQAEQPELAPTEEGPNLEQEVVPQFGREEKAVTTPAGALKKGKTALRGGDSGRAAKMEAGGINLDVEDPGAAVGAVEEAVNRTGGRISGHSYGEESHLLIIRINRQKIPELVDRLGHIGTVLDKPQLPKGAEGLTDLTIRW
ncbi:MAG TPA: DUF2275 domain-containing protein [Geobacteraceae bacterium]|nr:DUF2275 domain-containing protein [Geobacteraceae bacterium]